MIWGTASFLPSPPPLAGDSQSHAFRNRAAVSARAVVKVVRKRRDLGVFLVTSNLSIGAWFYDGIVFYCLPQPIANSPTKGDFYFSPPTWRQDFMEGFPTALTDKVLRALVGDKSGSSAECRQTYSLPASIEVENVLSY